MIGADLTEGTEVIYQIHTNEPEKLPEERRKYKFDNKGFFVGEEIKSSNESYCGNYLIYERETPVNILLWLFALDIVKEVVLNGLLISDYRWLRS